MNKKNNRKGFTTVELVIVIAVIAILATVLIPTFSNLIGKANESAALQEATNVLKSYTIENATTFNDDTVVYIVAGDGKYVFKAEQNKLAKAALVLDKDNPTEIPCNSIVIKKDDAVTAGYSAATTLPAGLALEECDTAGEGGKCSVCGK